jgi:hypothetical protein
MNLASEWAHMSGGAATSDLCGQVHSTAHSSRDHLEPLPSYSGGVLLNRYCFKVLYCPRMSTGVPLSARSPRDRNPVGFA